jgi:deoxyribodipyrimidine photo-lyase
MAAVFWFRRDLRLEDNHGLFRALKDNERVLPIFIFDSNILSKLEDKDDARLTFLHAEVSSMKKELEKTGSSIIVRHGEPEKVLKQLTGEYKIDKVYTNRDYEPYATERDRKVIKFLQEKKIAFLDFKDQVIFEKGDILKDDGDPYTVFTPYMRRWKSSFQQGEIMEFNPKPYFKHLHPLDPQPMPTLDDLGFIPSNLKYPARKADANLISNYHETRDIPSLNGTSRLSIHLRFGTISIRQLVNKAAGLNEVFLNELIWREFYMMILWHFPHVMSRSFKPQYDMITWRNDEEEFRAWCEGKTGYPIVDAGMRQLNETGYMHNRLRMITASFLTKLLLIDWRWGEAYFARKLLDYELASNNGGWQWSAGTGCDAAPYFRIFNPDSQTKKFDPEHKYIRTWVPELETEQYPERVVDYKAARERALTTYRDALK